MYSNERQDEIMRRLQIQGTVSVAALAAELYASEATVRRDLSELERQGLLRRIHGAATLSSGAEREVPMSLREREGHAEKSRIAEAAVALVKNGDTLLLDASSTVLHLVPLLTRFEEITVITNGPKTSLALAERQIKNYCTGGLLLGQSLAYIGPLAERLIREVQADIAFFSCRGLGENGRLSDSSLEEISIRQVMMKHAAKRVCLCDSNKLGKEYLHTLCAAEDLDALFCDRPLPFLQPGTARQAASGQRFSSREAE